MTKFEDDLKRGMDFEQQVLNVLNKDSVKYIKNPDEKWIDLLEISGGVEVKADHYNFHKNIKNGNAYIEFESYWKPSGIFKEEAYDLKRWIHSVSPESFFILHWKKFRKWIREKIEACNANSSNTSKGFRTVNWGDGNRTKGLLVPVAELEKQAFSYYNI